MAEGYFDFTAGSGLAAAQIEDYCQNQSTMRFPTTAARDAALTLVKTEGMVTYQKDTDRFTWWNGTAWRGMRSSVHGSGTPVAFAAQGFATEQTVCTLVVPDQGCEGTLFVSALARLDTGGVAAFHGHTRLYSGATLLTEATDTTPISSYNTVSACSIVQQAAGTASTLTLVFLRAAGTGTATTYADSKMNRIQAIFVPS